MPEGKHSKQEHVSCTERNRNQRQNSTGKSQAQSNDLVPQIGTIVRETPDSIQGYFQRHEYPRGSNQQNEERS